MLIEKSIKMKHILVLIITIAIIVIIASCSLPALKSGDITDDNLSSVCGMLEEHGLHNVSTFEEWVRSTNSGAEQEDASGFSDADCRMTVMLLAGGDIKSESVEKSYDGTYLMFDMDLISNNEEFSILKPKEKLFTTLFGEMPVSGDFEDAFPENLKKYGITFTGENYSVISLVFKAYEEEEAFVGHTGILVPYKSGYLFIEKIAFSEPYKVTVVKDEKELIAVLSERPDYTVEENEPSPLVYKDDELIGSLDK